MISKATIDNIFSTMRIEDIIGEYVQLKRAGANLKGLSPFQDEKTPSFVVSPSRQIWKDFSSGKGGNAISFLMEKEGFSYPEALRYVAKKYGIEIKEEKSELNEEQQRQQSEKELLYNIHEVANEFFQNSLWETQEGRIIGQSYFHERALRKETIQKFQLGYSPEQRDAFTQYALSKGYTKDILEKAGLSIFTDKSPHGIDRFRERVIFPIHSFSGRVLGFGARILKSNVNTAKYLNSPETSIYHKSNVLYGILQSKQAIIKKQNCLLVEGYLDVISLHQIGIENVVASSGTALTKEQIKLIKRLTDNITILFDGDNAGIKASFRSIDLLLEEDMNIKIALFPDGDDPDSFSRKHPSMYVEQFIESESQDFINFKANILLQNINNDPLKKAEAIRDIVKSISHISNPIKQEIYIKEVSHKFQISEQSLFGELGIQKQITKPAKQQNTQHKLDITTNEEQKVSNSALLSSENKLVELLLKYGDYILTHKTKDGENYQITVAEEIVNYLAEDDYQILSETNQFIINEVREGIENHEIRMIDYFKNIVQDNIAAQVADIAIEKYNLSNWEAFNIFFPKENEVVPKIINDTILRHKREYVVQIINNLKINIPNVEDPNESYQQIISLTALKNEIDNELSRIL